jgi:hypothetical protein
LRILIACEFSGVIREAFRRRGHDAMSCDLLPSEQPGPHHQGDVRALLHDGWDLMIAHPPCTHLAVSGARWFAGKKAQGELFLQGTRQDEALQLFCDLLQAPIARIALENPISIASSKVRRPDQIIHPWQFGHPETKTTCLWLKHLPLLEPTHICSGPIDKLRVRDEPRRADRWKQRSRSYPGIAEAMAIQWGDAITGSQYPAWIPCPCCVYEFLCTIHQCHTFECPCPPIEDWTVDPYETGGRQL